MSTSISGILVPNLVPFTSRGAINEAELRRLVSWLIGKGVHGLYPNGSTGEFIRLSFEERKRIVEIIADETAGRVPILAGAAEGNIELTLEMCEHCANHGCAAVSLTGPYYYSVNAEGLEHYFREIAQRTPIDILAYNIPQFANEIPLEVLARLAADCPRIIGTKDSSKDMPRFMHTLNTVKAVRPDFIVLTGAEELLTPSLLMGADGGTIATAQVVPEAITQLYQAARRGDVAASKKIQFKLLDLMKTMLSAGNFPDGFRAGAALRGFDFGPPRQPVPPATQPMLDDIQAHIACTLAECGITGAAAKCRPLPRNGSSPHAAGVEPEQVQQIVKAVLEKLGR
jgi:4-hydroxy-tetrahydrodipicolinate synthase